MIKILFPLIYLTFILHLTANASDKNMASINLLTQLSCSNDNYKVSLKKVQQDKYAMQIENKQDKTITKATALASAVSEQKDTQLIVPLKPEMHKPKKVTNCYFSFNSQDFVGSESLMAFPRDQLIIKRLSSRNNDNFQVSYLKRNNPKQPETVEFKKCKMNKIILNKMCKEMTPKKQVEVPKEIKRPHNFALLSHQ